MFLFTVIGRCSCFFGIYAIIFGKKISKRQRLTNWEADTLTESQKKYAALDAWACLNIYRHLNQATFETRINEAL